MYARNVHRRPLPEAQPIARLLDRLGGPEDRLWPSDRWPPLRLDRPLQVGARGGHGPIRYWVELYEPGRRVRFRFRRPRGFHGFHEFHLLTGGDQRPELVHIVEVHLAPPSAVLWVFGLRVLHDAVLEDLLDNAERHAGGTVARPARWSRHVRALRRLATASPRAATARCPEVRTGAGRR